MEWVVDSILHNYWLHNRIWINDPDFLIVRGMDTSTEKETNVMNPNANNPNPVEGSQNAGGTVPCLMKLKRRHGRIL